MYVLKRMSEQEQVWLFLFYGMFNIKLNQIKLEVKLVATKKLKINPLTNANARPCFHFQSATHFLALA